MPVNNSRRIFVSSYLTGVLAYLTSGQLLEAKELLKKPPEFTRSEISTLIELYAAQSGEQLKYEESLKSVQFEKIQVEIASDLKNKKYLEMNYFILTRTEIKFLMSQVKA